MTGPEQTYLMESAREAARLEAKTEDAVSERLLRLAGLAPGMRALDAGAGTGAVARTMSRIVGAAGHVVVLERERTRLALAAQLAQAERLTNLSFREGDVVREVPPQGPYDFVWCRFVFEYLAEPEECLANLVRAARPGAKVVVADTDGHAAFHHPLPPALERGLSRVFSALEGRFDPYAGRKLYHYFRRAGLSDIRVHVEPYHVYAGVAPRSALDNWELKLATIEPVCAPAFGGADAYRAWANAFLELLASPDSFTYSTLIMVEGRRP